MFLFLGVYVVYIGELFEFFYFEVSLLVNLMVGSSSVNEV